MPKYGMVIDLQKCVGCGACAIACKTENNTQDRRDGQTFNWADYKIEMKGKFPNVSYSNTPVLCNHCTNAFCVKACPVTPKAMFKSPDGLTLYNNDRCIGCRSCQRACPYSAFDVDKEDAAYSVISFNGFNKETHAAYRDKEEIIKNCTASGKEIADRVGELPPHRTDYDHPDYRDVRKPGVVEKCTFCAHRIDNNQQPYCVSSCPSGARTFGDLSDSTSNVSKLLAKYGSKVLKPEAGTVPNVHYIRNYKVSSR